MRISNILILLVMGGCGFPNDYGNLNLASAAEPTPTVKTVSADTVQSLSPWEGQIKSQPPEVKPFVPPTLHGDNVGYNAARLQLDKAPRINSEAIFDRIMKCYPARSMFGGLEVKATGRVTSSQVTSTLDDGSEISSNNYVGIVATMPLYSETELTRRIDREAGRRSDTATAIASFSEAIARRNQQLRLVSMYRALEARSAKRVATGVISATEQIGYLEKVSTAHTALIKAESDILEARLKLVSRCRDSVAPTLNEWLKDVSKARAATK